jgi:hypothetical protein
MIDSRALDPHSLPIHIAYSRLRAESFGTILLSCARIADEAFIAYARIQEKALAVPLPALELSTITTGSSVKFTFGEGWWPRVRSDSDHDIIIETPKKLGVPLLIGFLLLNGAASALDVRNKYLDHEIKTVELQLKKQELARILEQPQSAEKMKSAARDVVQYVLRDNDLVSVQVYNVDLKKPQRDSLPPDRPL